MDPINYTSSSSFRNKVYTYQNEDKSIISAFFLALRDTIKQIFTSKAKNEMGNPSNIQKNSLKGHNLKASDHKKFRDQKLNNQPQTDREEDNDGIDPPPVQPDHNYKFPTEYRDPHQAIYQQQTSMYDSLLNILKTQQDTGSDTIFKNEFVSLILSQNNEPKCTAMLEEPDNIKNAYNKWKDHHPQNNPPPGYQPLNLGVTPPANPQNNPGVPANPPGRTPPQVQNNQFIPSQFQPPGYPQPGYPPPQPQQFPQPGYPPPPPGYQPLNLGVTPPANPQNNPGVPANPPGRTPPQPQQFPQPGYPPPPPGYPPPQFPPQNPGVPANQQPFQSFQSSQYNPSPPPLNPPQQFPPQNLGMAPQQNNQSMNKQPKYSYNIGPGQNLPQNLPQQFPQPGYPPPPINPPQFLGQNQFIQSQFPQPGQYQQQQFPQGVAPQPGQYPQQQFPQQLPQGVPGQNNQFNQQPANQQDNPGVPANQWSSQYNLSPTPTANPPPFLNPQRGNHNMEPWKQ